MKYVNITTVKDDATPLIAAIIENDLDKMRRILEGKYAQIHYVDSLDGPALCYAIRNNNIEAAKLLIEYDVDVNHYYSYAGGATPIFGARAEMTQLLIDNNANPHWSKAGWGFKFTPFAEAVFLLDIGTMDVLLGNGVDISFHKSLENDKLTEYPMVDKILKGIISIPYYFSLYIYMPPLIKAIYEEDIEKVKKLLNKGTDVNIRFTRLNTTPLMMAAQKVNVPIMQLLIAHGADINARTKTGWNALFFAVLRARYGRNENAIQAMQLLLDNNIDVNTQNDSGLTPLMFASIGRPYQYAYETANPIEILLKHGADINIKNINGKEAFLLESELQYLHLLQENNAEISIQESVGKTGLE